MNIVVVGTAYPYRGGLAAFNERLARQWQKEGHNVEIYTFSLQYPSFLFPGKTQFSSEPAPSDLVSLRKVNSCNPFNWLKVGREISKKKPDLVIFAYWMSFMAPCMGTMARKIRKNRHTKVIALVHNMIPHEPNILDKLFPKYFVKSMDGFLALSKSVVDDIRKFDRNNRPKTFSPHPIYDHYGKIITQSDALDNLGLHADCKYVLFFGFIRAYKGLDLLLEAFADKRIAERNIKLIVAGEFYGDSAPYLKQIKDLGIGEKVILRTDFIPDSEVYNYFCAANLVAQPYKSATQSGVTQIAFHFEKPMLVTNVGGLAEIVPNGKIGYVVEPQPVEIANAIVDYFDNGRETEFRANTIEEKKKYDWKNITQSIRKLLE